MTDKKNKRMQTLCLASSCIASGAADGCVYISLKATAP